MYTMYVYSNLVSNTISRYKFVASVIDSTLINIHSLFTPHIYNRLQHVTYSSDTYRHNGGFLIHKTQVNTGRLSGWYKLLLTLKIVEPFCPSLNSLTNC
jgi:hypothetical protein